MRRSRSAWGRSHSPRSHGSNTGNLHHDWLVDSVSGSVDCSRRGVDHCCPSGRSEGTHSIGDIRSDSGDDRAWCVFDRCTAVRKETFWRLKAQPRRGTLSSKVGASGHPNEMAKIPSFVACLSLQTTAQWVLWMTLLRLRQRPVSGIV